MPYLTLISVPYWKNAMKVGRNMFLFFMIVLILGIVYLYSNRETVEDLLLLKLVGYYILGAFYFNLNGLVIPLGFLISFLFRPVENLKIKREASIFGLIMMIIGLFLN